MTKNEKLAIGIGLGGVAMAVSPTLRAFVLDVLKAAAASIDPTGRDLTGKALRACDATIDVEWIEIDVSDLTLH